MSKIDKFVKLFKKVLPPGKLWRVEEQPTFKKLITAFMQEFVRVDDKIDEVLLTVDPRTVDAGIDYWEAMFGLPDECTGELGDLEARRNQIVQRLTNVGGLSKEFYEFVGNQLGFENVTVSNWLAFRAGSRAGDPLTNYWEERFVAGSQCGNQLYSVGWQYYFNVDMPVTAATIFKAGSTAGEPLRDFTNELLQCTYRKIKPAKAGVTFSFFE